MNWIPPTVLLATTWLVVFAQSWFTGLRETLHVQPNLLPGLVVYAAFNGGLPMTTAVAVLAGLGSDALSSGPFGLGVVPLLGLGLLLHRRRELILQDSTWAQAALGLTASLAVTLASLGLLFVLWPLLSERTARGTFQPELRLGLSMLPPLRVGLIWQLFVVGVFGAASTPLVFGFFRWIETRFNYRRVPPPLWQRLQRERARGRI